MAQPFPPCHRDTIACHACRSAASKLAITVGSSAIDFETDYNTPEITGKSHHVLEPTERLAAD